MEISEIKNKLTLSQVLNHYGLKPDKNNRLRCPFHPDKTPSLQIYPQTQTCYCFSTNCKTHGKSIDVIDFILHKEGVSKHEAILKAKAMFRPDKVGQVRPDKVGQVRPDKVGQVRPSEVGQVGAASTQSHQHLNEQPERIAVLTKMFSYFKKGMTSSKPARDYLQKRGLDPSKTEVGYNSGQFHHGKRKDENLIAKCLEYGLLLDLRTKGRTGNPAYKPFGKWGLVFALRNVQHQIVGLYFRSIHNDKAQRHFYLKDRQGLYPSYPNLATKKLILTESIIDAATLLACLPDRQEQVEIAKNYSILALFGTNGLGAEHQRAIKQWVGGLPDQHGREIIFFLNGDAAGKKAVAKYAPLLKTDYPKLKITNVEVPEGEDVNSLLQGHEAAILMHLIDERKEYKLFLSTETPSNETQLNLSELQAEEKKVAQTGLGVSNPNNLKYTGAAARYQIKGFKMQQLDSLKITLQINRL